jgi:hypothetical protein
MRRSLCVVLIVIAINLFCHETVAAQGLRLEKAYENEINGSFKVLLYGSRHGNDLETIAFLDPLEDGFELELYTPDFNYRVENKMDAKEAIKIAKTFVGWHSSFKSYSIGKLISTDGRVLGYEVRPLYMPIDYGMSDIFDNSYWLRGNKVVIRIRLHESLERRLYDIDPSREDK